MEGGRLMKRKKIEQWILLEQSGELPTRLRLRLQAALRQDPELRNWKTAVQQLPGLISPPKAEPRQSLVFNILREARKTGATPTARPATFLLKPTLALALLALVLVHLPGLRPDRPSENPTAFTGLASNKTTLLEIGLTLGSQNDTLLEDSLTEEARLLDFFFRGELHI